MAYLNMIMLIGNVGRDPEIRMTANGQKKALFSIATTKKFRDKQTGEERDITQWHNIIAWRGTADLIERFGIKKGASLFIKGEIQYRQWEDPSTGAKKQSTDILVEEFQILTPKSNAAHERTSGSHSNGNAVDRDYNHDDDVPW